MVLHGNCSYTTAGRSCVLFPTVFRRVSVDSRSPTSVLLLKHLVPNSQYSQAPPPQFPLGFLQICSWQLLCRAAQILGQEAMPSPPSHTALLCIVSPLYILQGSVHHYTLCRAVSTTVHCSVQYPPLYIVQGSVHYYTALCSVGVHHCSVCRAVPPDLPFTSTSQHHWQYPNSGAEQLHLVH